MKKVILDAIGTTAIVLGVIAIVFAAGGSDAGDFTLGRVLAQVGVGFVGILAGGACKAKSREEGN